MRNRSDGWQSVRQNEKKGGIERIFTKAFGKDVFCSFALKCQCSEVAKRLQQIMHAQS